MLWVVFYVNSVDLRFILRFMICLICLFIAVLCGMVYCLVLGNCFMLFVVYRFCGLLSWCIWCLGLGLVICGVGCGGFLLFCGFRLLCLLLWLVLVCLWVFILFVFVFVAC